MNEQNPQPQQQETKALQEIKSDISAQVLAKVDAFQKAGELRIPKDYSPENALKSAYIVLSDPKQNLLTKCDKGSIANALLKMVVYGLSPLKGQCYFIPYGNKLECTVDYSGNIALAKRYGGLKDIKANAVFEGDEFEFEVAADGTKRVTKHVQTMQSIATPVVGAYAVVEMQDGSRDTEVMGIDMIHKSWKQGGAKGLSPAHQNFPDQMSIKTVINRACKLLIRSSDDSVLFGSSDETDDRQEREKKVVEASYTEVIDPSENEAQTLEETSVRHSDDRASDPREGEARTEGEGSEEVPF